MANEHPHQDHESGSHGSYWSSRAFLVFLGFAAIAIALLWKEHSAHILGVVPYLFILACPLMHIFMHGGHGGHGHHGGHNHSAEQDGAPPSGATGEWGTTKKGDKS